MEGVKEAASEYPIHELIARRWSPYGFAERPVSREDLQSIFEAARWAPSSRNEQPWFYIVAVKDQEEEFGRLLSCLVEQNQIWAKAAPVLALGVVSLTFSRNGRPNGHAVHDLGLASANLTLEATSRGLLVHQMAGLLPGLAREIYQIPEGWEVTTALGIGYPEQVSILPDHLRQRELSPRHRKHLSEFVFQGSWGKCASFLSEG